MTHRRLDGLLISLTQSFTLALFQAKSASVETTCMQFPEDSHKPQVAINIWYFANASFTVNSAGTRQSRYVYNDSQNYQQARRDNYGRVVR